MARSRRYWTNTCQQPDCEVTGKLQYKFDGYYCEDHLKIAKDAAKIREQKISSTIESLFDKNVITTTKQISNQSGYSSAVISASMKKRLKAGEVFKLNPGKKPTIWISKSKYLDMQREKNMKETGFSETDQERKERLDREEEKRRVQEEKDWERRLKKEQKRREEEEREKNFLENGKRETNSEREARETQEDLDARQRYGKKRDDEWSEYRNQSLDEFLSKYETMDKNLITALKNEDLKNFLKDPDNYKQTLLAVSTILGRTDVWAATRNRFRKIVLEFLEEEGRPELHQFESIGVPQETIQKMGCCIRDYNRIPFNINSPFCEKCTQENENDTSYHIWKPEKICHRCSQMKSNISEGHPLCKSCKIDHQKTLTLK